MTTRTTPTVVGFDVETHLIRRGRNIPRMVCLSLFGGDYGAGWVLDARDGLITWADLIHAAANGEVLLVAANAAFDLSVLVEAALTRGALWGVDGEAVLSDTFKALDRGMVADVCLRQTLIDIALGRNTKRSYALSALVSDHLGLDISASKSKDVKATPDTHWNAVVDALGCTCGPAHFGPAPRRSCDLCDGWGLVGPWRLRYAQLDGVPVDDWPEAAARYAIEDSEHAVMVWVSQASDPHVTDLGIPVVDVATGRVVDEDRQVRASFFLQLMASWGPRTDGAAVDILQDDIQAQVDAGNKAALDAGFLRGPDGRVGASTEAGRLLGTISKGKPHTRDMKALAALVRQAYGDATPLTETGRVSASRDVLVQSGHPALEAYAAAGPAMKVLTTYVPILRLGTDHPITSRPLALKDTGRTGWTNPSLQTGPRGMGYRECFTAREGWVYVSVDYDAIEFMAWLQILLWMGLGDTMARVVNDGKDPHLWVASFLGGVDYQTAVGIHGDATHPRHKEFAGPTGHRQLAKIANYGFMGGMGVDAFITNAAGYGVTLTPEDASTLKNAWMDAIPEARGYFDDVGRRCVVDTFTLEGWYSRRQRGNLTFTQGCNSQFQALVADAAKDGAWGVSKAAYVDKTSPLYGRLRPWVFQHDEVIASLWYDADPVGATKAAVEMARIMKDAMKDAIPDLPIGADPALSRRWSKGARTVWKGGVLVPCDD